MSVAEIKEELKHLSPPELIEIEKLAAELRRNSSNDSTRGREIHPNDPGVPEAMDKVFQTHHELFRRLAQ